MLCPPLSHVPQPHLVTLMVPMPLDGLDLRLEWAGRRPDSMCAWRSGPAPGPLDPLGGGSRLDPSGFGGPGLRAGHDHVACRIFDVVVGNRVVREVPCKLLLDLAVRCCGSGCVLR